MVDRDTGSASVETLPEKSLTERVYGKGFNFVDGVTHPVIREADLDYRLACATDGERVWLPRASDSPTGIVSDLIANGTRVAVIETDYECGSRVYSGAETDGSLVSDFIPFEAAVSLAEEIADSRE